MKKFKILPISQEKRPHLQHKIDNKTKPLGALGQLEYLAVKIGCIQNTLSPQLVNPTIVVFAGDHGIATEGVSLYPQSVTYQMVLNFLAGGAAINVFAHQHNIALYVVDAGVNHQFEPHPQLLDCKIALGTKNFLKKAAMTQAQCQQAIRQGAMLVKDIQHAGCNVISFGEMGIGNTSAASLLAHFLADIPLADCVGKGTGLDKKGVTRKLAVLQQAIVQHTIEEDALKILATFGGFEIAMMVGAYLQAAESHMVILVDGFIATSALLVAAKLYPNVVDYCIFSHQSQEKGHRLMLKYLNAKPLLHLEMRLGEGSGSAVAFPIVQSAVYFLNKMASFESAGVSQVVVN